MTNSGILHPEMGEDATFSSNHGRRPLRTEAERGQGFEQSGKDHERAGVLRMRRMGRMGRRNYATWEPAGPAPGPTPCRAAGLNFPAAAPMNVHLPRNTLPDAKRIPY